MKGCLFFRLRRRGLFFLCFLIFLTITGCSIIREKRSYLKQKKPGDIPQVFAPDILSLRNENEFGIAVTENGDEIFYAVNLSIAGNTEIRHTKLVNGEWTKPIRLPFSNKYNYNDPFLSLDENRLYFISTWREADQKPFEVFNIMYIERKNDGWSNPINLGEPINSDRNEYYISLSSSGTAFFSTNRHEKNKNSFNYDIHFASWENGEYSLPIRLGEEINSKTLDYDPFIAPDESYLIFSSNRPDGFGKSDLYISFKQIDGNWSTAINMGEEINTGEREFCPFVSKDGKFLFFSRSGDIFWIRTKVIKERKKESLTRE